MKRIPLTLTLIIMTAYITTQSIAAERTVTGGHFIEVDGLNFHYRTGGTGPVLFILHGFTLSSEQWIPFFDAFAENYTVIAVDMPGHGKSDRLPSKFGFNTWSDLMLKVLDQMNIKSIHAMGHSAGAITLMHMALQNPDLLDSMILIDGGHRSTYEAREELRHDSFDKAPEALQKYYLDIHFSDMDRISALFEDVRYMAEKMPLSTEDSELNEQTLANFNMPVFLIWGDRDFFFPIDICTELHQYLPNPKLWVIPGQGHTPLWPFMGGDESATKDFPEIADSFFDQHE